uniref:Cell division control protein 45 homolog (inferred by orthology to a human protein) n=1 Tax=Strongyloides venezuelensis TaxID=75913 RepID=A0A0K0F5L9_STRVS
MIIQEDFKKNFYDVISQRPTCVIFNTDVDALCSFKILNTLLKFDDISITFIAVDSFTDLQSLMGDCIQLGGAILLINCGGNKDLNIIDRPEDTIVFVLDSRRPICLKNIYGDDSIRVLLPEGDLDDLQIPPANSLYDYTSSDEEDAENEESGFERTIRHENNARRFQQNQRYVLAKYYEFSWTAIASSVFMIELAHSMGKSNIELMWCGVVGLTSQMVDKLITQDAFTNACVDRLAMLIKKFTNSKTGELDKSDDKLRLTFDIELLLPLYRHWSLIKSMSQSENYIAKAKLYTQSGVLKMKHLLVQLGIELNEVNQNYSTLNAQRRKEIFGILIEDQKKRYIGFTAHFGYYTKYSANDFSRLLSNEMAKNITKESASKRITDAWSLLSNFIEGFTQKENIPKAIEDYKVSLEAVTEIAYNYLNTSQLFVTRQYCVVRHHTTLDLHYLYSPHFFNIFASLIKKCYLASKGNRNIYNIPIFFEIPGIGDNIEYVRITGHMPINSTFPDDGYIKNSVSSIFYNVIEQASINVEYRDSFDSNVVYVKTDQRQSFYESVGIFIETNLT